MRMLLYLSAALAVVGLAFWAYQENYRTIDALAEVRVLQRDIAEARDTLGILRGEWAYLNRPERLRDLAEINFDLLGLLPMEPQRFGRVDQISYPSVIAPLGLITGVVETNATLGGAQ